MKSLESERKLLLSEYAILQEEKRRRKKARGYLYYQPHEKQKLYHLSKAFIRLLVTGNRFGKTEAAFVEYQWFLTGEYPDWYPIGMRYNREVSLRWCCPDFEKGVGEIFQEKVDKYMPWEKILRVEKNSRGFVVKYYYNNGSRLDLVTYEQDILTYEGVARDRVHFDEPPPRDKFVASLRACVDRGGKIGMTLTPISEPWIFDELYMQDGEEVRFKDLDIECISGTIYDNPHLNTDYIKKFEIMLTPEEKQSRIHGKFLTLTGIVYKQLSKVVHGRERFVIPSEWPRWMVVDPHDRRPHYISWFAVDETDDIYWYRGVTVEGTIKDVVKYIKEIEEMNGERINRRIIDPNFGKKIYGNSKLTVQQEFQKEGQGIGYDIRMSIDVDDSISIGHQVVKDYLHYNPGEPISLTNKPKLYIFSDLKEVWHQMQRYIHDEWKQSALEKDPKEAPKSKNKDFPDTLRYCLMDKPHWVEAEVYKPDENYSYV